MIPKDVFMTLTDYLTHHEEAKPEDMQFSLIRVSDKACNRALDKMYNTEVAKVLTEYLFESPTKDGILKLLKCSDHYEKQKLGLDKLKDSGKIDKKDYEKKIEEIHNQFLDTKNKLKGVYGLKNAIPLLDSFYSEKYVQELLNDQQLINNNINSNQQSDGTVVVPDNRTQPFVNKIEEEKNKKKAEEQNKIEEENLKQKMKIEQEADKRKSVEDMKAEQEKSKIELENQNKLQQAMNKIEQEKNNQAQQIVTRNINQPITMN